MLLTVEVTMIAFASFIIEADNAATVLAVEQSVLEQMLAPRNGLRHLPDNNLDNSSIWQNRFEPMEKRRCNHDVIYAIAQARCQSCQRADTFTTAGRSIDVAFRGLSKEPAYVRHQPNIFNASARRTSHCLPGSG
jgi:hypothetical protein